MQRAAGARSAIVICGVLYQHSVGVVDPVEKRIREGVAAAYRHQVDFVKSVGCETDLEPVLILGKVNPACCRAAGCDGAGGIDVGRKIVPYPDIDDLDRVSAKAVEPVLHRDKEVARRLRGEIGNAVIPDQLGVQRLDRADRGAGEGTGGKDAEQRRVKQRAIVRRLPQNIDLVGGVRLQRHAECVDVAHGVDLSGGAAAHGNRAERVRHAGQKVVDEAGEIHRQRVASGGAVILARNFDPVDAIGRYSQAGDKRIGVGPAVIVCASRNEQACA